MTIYDFKKGEIYIYFHSPCYLETFTVTEIFYNKETKHIAIDTDNPWVGVFFIDEKDVDQIDNVGVYLSDSDTYLLKYDILSKLYLKKRIYVLNAKLKLLYEKINAYDKIQQVIKKYKIVIGRLKKI